jgi:hypothetical protein
MWSQIFDQLLISWVDVIHDNWYTKTYNEFTVCICAYIEAHSTRFQRLKELEPNVLFLQLWIILFCDLTTHNHEICISKFPPFFVVFSFSSCSHQNASFYWLISSYYLYLLLKIYKDIKEKCIAY